MNLCFEIVLTCWHQFVNFILKRDKDITQLNYRYHGLSTPIIKYRGNTITIINIVARSRDRYL